LIYKLSEQQIDFILNDIKSRGVVMEDLQLNLLDHICCIVENELNLDDDFDKVYQDIITRFFKKELKEIEEETILLLTFKNYYTMKKIMVISGIFSVATFLLGLFLKFMHLPGAGVFLFFGIMTLSLIFLPLLFVLKIKDVNTKREKVVAGVGTLAGMLVSISVLFKVMHWPFANVLGVCALFVFVFIFIPLYFFNGVRNPNTKLNTIVSTILFVGASGLLFTLIDTRPAYHQTEVKMYAYLESEDLLKRLQSMPCKASASNTQQQLIISKMNDAAEQMKTLILIRTTGKSKVSNDFENEEIFLEERNLGPAFEQGQKGALLYGQFKNSIEEYNLLNGKSNALKIPIDHFEDGKIVLYNNFVVLDYITKTQMYVALIESSANGMK
jgi:hypothetical protein